MNSSEFFDMGKPLPKRVLQLQGPRPAPLKVCKDSYTIKKPPAAPSLPGAAPSQQPSHPDQPRPPQQHRPPVIIYTVSPKVIHVKASEFMTLVQRLTGASSSSSSSSSSADAPASSVFWPSGCFSPSAGALSPAARLAVIEMTQKPSSSSANKSDSAGEEYLVDIVDQLDIGGSATTLDRSGNFPGILSPLPSALPSISPNFFSPPSADPNSLAFLNDIMSPIFQGNNNNNNNKSNYMENTFLLLSPSNLFSTSTLPSPGAYWDLFSQL